MQIIEKSLRTEVKTPPQTKGASEHPEPDREEMHDTDTHWYICSQCGQRIAQYEARTTVGGQHRHVFSNPSGIVFEIACFSTAKGYAFSGGYSTDFAWFAGYAWRITICSRCMIHLGWVFSSSDGGHFFGFITDRVVAESISPEKS